MPLFVFGQVVLQVLIILSGNYNFFNLLTIALCFSLLDDQHVNFLLCRRSPQKERSMITLCFSTISFCLIHLLTVNLFYTEEHV